MLVVLIITASVLFARVCVISNMQDTIINDQAP
jgi:hypothetical protein